LEAAPTRDLLAHGRGAKRQRHNLRHTPARASTLPTVTFFARVAILRGLPEATAPIVFEMRAAR
jgi:hypothetical protein